jgi:N-carbamoylputrescine amidase
LPARRCLLPDGQGIRPRRRSTARRSTRRGDGQRSHAIANGVFVAVPNRVGHEPHPGGAGIEFWGQSFVVDPAGRVLVRASADREEILVVPCDLGAIETARTHWPFLRDRRIDAYAGILNRLND